jgi:hypothetical protein
MVKHNTDMHLMEVREIVAGGLQTQHGGGMVRPIGAGMSRPLHIMHK